MPVEAPAFQPDLLACEPAIAERIITSAEIGTRLLTIEPGIRRLQSGQLLTEAFHDVAVRRSQVRVLERIGFQVKKEIR